MTGAHTIISNGKWRSDLVLCLCLFPPCFIHRARTRDRSRAIRASHLLSQLGPICGPIATRIFADDIDYLSAVVCVSSVRRHSTVAIVPFSTLHLRGWLRCKLALCCVLHDAIRLAASPPSHANPAIANGRGRHGQWNEPQPPGWNGKIDIYIASGVLSSFRMVVCTFSSSSSSSSSSTLTTLPAVYFSQLVHH